MNREDLLKGALSGDKSVSNVIGGILEGDKKFIRRAKRDLEDSIEDLQFELKQRLSSDTPIDKATVEVLYGGIKEKEAALELYKTFEAETFLKKSE